MLGSIAYELIAAVVAIVAITAGYVWLGQEGVPQPSSFWGHSLGIVGFLLMLSTETLYSIRKRLPGFHLGRMSLWLQAHIFTGLVGAYLVLLHSAWKFNGLAGILSLLTVVVVLSGLIGRYIYTAVPRTLDGVEVAMSELEARLSRSDQLLRKVGGERWGKAALAAATAPTPRGWFGVLGRPIIRSRQRGLWRRLLNELDDAGRAQAVKVQDVVIERQRLQMQINSWEATRQLLALWHMFHVPLSGALFALAFVHIGAVLYYATFLK